MTLSFLPSVDSHRPGPVDCRPRFYTPRDYTRQTAGGDVAQIAAGLGKSFLPWQRELIDTAYEIDPDTGMLWYAEIVVLVPRQSGKSTLIIPVGLHRALGWATPQTIMYYAQTRKAAKRKWQRDQVKTIIASPYVRTLMLPVRTTNGDEGMDFRNGSFWSVDAPTETGGHGDTLGLGIIDEAWSQRDSRIEQAISPAMATIDDAQQYTISTAGKPWSTFLKNKVDAGRARTSAGLKSRILYLEYSMPDDADPYDEMQWWANMPALGHTIGIERVRSDAEKMTEDEFRRAYGNQWRENYFGDWPIPQESWNDCLDANSQIEGALVWSIDVSIDQSASAIAVAGLRADNKTHVEIVEYLPGTTWLPTRMAELQRAYGGEVIGDLTGPLGGLVHRFIEEGVEIRPIKTAEMLQACGTLDDRVRNQRLAHIGNVELTTALAGATKLRSVDTWKWGRGKSMADICPLVAVTEAHWFLLEQLGELNYDPLAGIL